MRAADAVVWHDVECGAYTSDLPLWRELARHARGPVLDLGAGTGRVALDLAEHGYDVTALDVDRTLLDELERRAQRRGVRVEPAHGDARTFPVDRRFALVLAPMQFLQILGGPRGRAAVLRAAAGALVPGGRFAAALARLDDAVPPLDAAPPVPDVTERDGWVFSSLPLDVRPEPGGVAVERLRQIVTPAGELSEERHTQVLESLSAEQLEAEAAAAGLQPEVRHVIGATDDHVGSEVVVCRRSRSARSIPTS
ncbi:MAG TPA: class I SAM-dependent methyltransferase [Thermoleophilaceae bacterium]|nr:class I SAM-dependent methyltransferase [Thermoleophilaceae bacterium]